MTSGPPAAEEVFGQLAAMRVIPVVVLDDSAQAIAARAHAFGMRLIAHDPYMATDDVTAHGAP